MDHNVITIKKVSVIVALRMTMRKNKINHINYGELNENLIIKKDEFLFRDFETWIYALYPATWP